MVLFFFYLLKLTCKGCNDGVVVVVVVFIKDERINEFGVVVMVVLLFDADERF